MHTPLRPFLALLLALCGAVAQAQHIVPVTRFHASTSPYVTYADNFLSGFMQTAVADSLNGFLQTPFVGNPLLVYVGEKDSTQFTAYASGYLFTERRPAESRYRADFTRYKVKADVRTEGGYCVQQYTYPDTAAAKGFLLDLDHALRGAENEDMDVEFIDKRTIRAYRRSAEVQAGVPELYYVARFSHPFTTWNVRRETVRLEKGGMERRCKVAFTFALAAGQPLTVESAVSAVSTDDAYAQIESLPAAPHFDDARPERKPGDDRLLARTEAEAQREAAAARRAYAAENRRNLALPRGTRAAREAAKNPGALLPSDIIEISNREAEPRAAFYAAMGLLMQTRECRLVRDAADFLHRIEKFYRAEPAAADRSAAETDSLLHSYARELFTGADKQPSPHQAAWYVFNALGFVPTETADTYRLVRPLFNVATLYLPNDRRFILHAKNNSARNLTVVEAKFSHQPLPAERTFTRLQLLRGGVLSVKMQK